MPRVAKQIQLFWVHPLSEPGALHILSQEALNSFKDSESLTAVNDCAPRKRELDLRSSGFIA
jgi:hypothetical protein